MINYSLKELAKFQFEFSQYYCLDECKSYHASWAILRASGLVGGIDSDKDIYLDNIHNLFSSDKKINILIAGCADSGILNMVLESNLKNYEIDIVDRCKTPLESCKKIINSQNNIYTIQSDLLTFSSKKNYDLIICHSLLPFFDNEGRKILLKNFSQWLKSEGKLLVSLRESFFQPQKTNIKEKAMRAYEKILLEKNETSTLEDLEKYYEIIENQNLPYDNFEMGKNEFYRSGLEVISTFYGGVGKSFGSDTLKPKSLIFLAKKIT